MRHIYTHFYKSLLPLFLFVLLSHTGNSQTCPDGSPQGGTAYDTTIRFATGLTSLQVKFPQFDPQNGMVTCVKLCITITGVIDSLAMQNFSNSAQTGTFNYIRTDTIRGPGLVTPLSNTVNQSYGPFPLSPYDGIPGAGTDFYSQAHDTILNAQLCRTLNDSATIAQFYGSDSLTYDYAIDVSTGAFITGGSSSNLVLTSAFVNFHFEYCTCPAVVLPLNVRTFNLNKISDSKAELKWTGYDDPYANYHYEIEMSRTGGYFTSIATFDKKMTDEAYQYLFTAPNGESGRYYFRIRQVYSNGYVRYSNIMHVTLGNSGSPKFSLYPNPSTGIVGIKFDNTSVGHFNIQIFNSQGQSVVAKDIVTSGSSYVQLGTLPGGIYWLRLTDQQSQASYVNQLIIK
ncbi:MAG: T9SS type A sorting domain-containing protein [Chitinophagaceae bacterium]